MLTRGRNLRSNAVRTRRVVLSQPMQKEQENPAARPLKPGGRCQLERASRGREQSISHAGSQAGSHGGSDTLDGTRERTRRTENARRQPTPDDNQRPTTTNARRQHNRAAPKDPSLEKERAISTVALDRPQRLRFLVRWRVRFARRLRSSGLHHALALSVAAAVLATCLSRPLFFSSTFLLQKVLQAI
jgi:hypothetical protein